MFFNKRGREQVFRDMKADLASLQKHVQKLATKEDLASLQICVQQLVSHGVLERRVVGLEVELDELRSCFARVNTRIKELGDACDTLKARFVEAEAGAAKLREVLEEYEDVSSADSLEERIERGIRADKALSSDAGREMLERVKRLEGVAGAALGMQISAEFLLRLMQDAKRDGERIDVDSVPSSFHMRLAELRAALDALYALDGGESAVMEALAKQS